MTFDKHLSVVARSWNYHAHVSSATSVIQVTSQVVSICQSQNDPQILRGLILSRIDYCNALLYGAPASSSIHKMDGACSEHCRLAVRLHITFRSAPMAAGPTADHIQYKITVLTFKALSTLSQKTANVAEFGDSRTFLRQCGQALRSAVRRHLLTSAVSSQRESGRTRRSSIAPLLSVPFRKTTFSGRAFGCT